MKRWLVIVFVALGFLVLGWLIGWLGGKRYQERKQAGWKP